ncbi:Pentatricopeptide repeat (PPR) superfamily protein [Rhynchospora pubera]|uniref:Pentatricopeptide repeat (PPR) superfamily protein n=1 Tax=Rhynchospora pubera TaxID=906938 RepID=A0AAV8GT77_9POAL|nr:Pentatricopeptide repeat (PPR) superfamily protein [Rhynchospora pubera]
MALTLLSPSLSPLSPSFKTLSPTISTSNNTTFSSLSPFTSSLPSPSPLLRAYCSSKDGATSEKPSVRSFDDEFLRRISGLKDADQVFVAITESGGRNGVDTSDCNSLIAAAFERGNAELPLSLFDAMRLGFPPDDGLDGKVVTDTWRWPRPDIHTYALLVQGLATSLRVTDAIRIIGYVCGMGISSGEEVLFGLVIQCPTCKVAIAVAQPQNGIQIASCSKCRYKYELYSGDIVSIESEEISMGTSGWEKALIFLKVKKDELPSAIHSIVVRTPSGMARTHRFATKTADLPAQEGERVTISLSAPSNSYRELGPLKLGPRSAGLRPSEPLCLTNHATGQVSELLRPPDAKAGSGFINPYVVAGSLALLASGDVVSGFIDPGVPRIVSATVLASAAVDTVVNQVVLPELRKLPQKMVDVVALKQQLLSQYDLLQNRIKDLRQAAEKEVWMLARMSQLENKILAVGEPSYRARRGRVKKVRENLENALLARIELIESYAKISSMIEIEVEMDSDVVAAEAASSAERISEQIQQIMEIDNLEEQWRMQAEANDEVERLLNSDTLSNERT